jgi:hypothetical protein
LLGLLGAILAASLPPPRRLQAQTVTVTITK